MEKTRAGLESLTTRELIRMADHEGIDIFPGLERVFIIRELLESVEREGGESPQEPEGRPGKPCPVPLPQHYNFSYLDVLVRDPLWAFAFWEIGEAERERFEASPGFGGYCLRALSLENGPPVNSSIDSFIVEVGSGDNAWYVGFPPTGGRFRIELCLKLSTEAAGPGALRALALSPPFSMPRLFGSPETGNGLTPLARLSGAAHFSAIRPSRSAV